jgi:uncharacterized membrane protein
MVRLGTGPPNTYSAAHAASYDGSVIVGRWASQHAFLWDVEHGVRLISDILTSHGIDLTGWDLEVANAISWDGTTIVGTGSHNGHREAWIAIIPEPGTAVLAAIGIALLTAHRRSVNN